VLHFNIDDDVERFEAIDEQPHGCGAVDAFEEDRCREAVMRSYSRTASGSLEIVDWSRVGRECGAKSEQ
jgi:hypothetical protein